MKRILLFLLAVCAAGPGRAGAQEPLSATFLPRVQEILVEKIGPFGREKTIDRTDGGYLMNHDLSGQVRDNPVKMIVTQSRMVWHFSRMARAGFEPKENLQRVIPPRAEPRPETVAE